MVLQGYSDDNDITSRNTEPSIWEQPQRLSNLKDKTESVEVRTCCKSPRELLGNESFETFVRIFNTICADDAQARQNYGFKPATPEQLLQDKDMREKAYLLWQNLRLTGRLKDAQELDGRLKQWMTELDKADEKVEEAKAIRFKIGA